MNKCLALLLMMLMVPLTFKGQEPGDHRIIIDTDGTPDDLRAINLMLASPDTEVLAITSADGTLEPEEGLMKIHALLNSLGHQGIVTSQGIITKKQVTRARALAQAVPWGEEPLSYRQPPEVKELLVKTIEQQTKPVEVICLGPLTNIANAILMKPSIKSKIGRIIWFDQCQSMISWSNYGMDCLSADYLLGTQIPIYRIIAGEEKVPITPSYLEELGAMESRYAQSIFRTHQHDSIQKRAENKELKVWNDMAPMFMYYPDLFEKDTTFADSLGHVMKVRNADTLLSRIKEHLAMENSLAGVTFKSFPMDTSLYRQDLRSLSKQLIPKYGIQEWRAGVIAAELHGHMNLATLVGVKMGVRMMEYFRALPGELEIISYLNPSPPLSAINDGIQAACKATPGNGKLQINNSHSQPRALATYHGRQVEIIMKKEPLNKLQEAMEKLNINHSPHTPSYRKALRDRTLHYWQEWDRKDMFRIAEKNQ